MMPPNPIDLYAALRQAVQKPLGQTLCHVVEDAGYGATLSRIITGLNRAIALHANYHFTIDSIYAVDDLFDITVKQSQTSFEQSHKIYWDFWRETWSVKTRPYLWKFLVTSAYQQKIRGEHQFPSCPLSLAMPVTRHQWCAALAHAICGTPKPPLQEAITFSQRQMGWDQTQTIVGIHVRRGDKNTECPYIPNYAYINQFCELTHLNQNAKWAIFLTSDDPECHADFVKALPHIPIYWDSAEARFNNCNIHMIKAQPQLAWQESVTAAKNISLLGQCDYVIGMASAQFTWIGGLLCVFRHGLDTTRHIMLDSQTAERGHWALSYGFSRAELLS
jgi:hypothetical protein